MNHLVLASSYLVKSAAEDSPDPRTLAMLQGGLAGAGAGGLVQLLRRLFQSKRDEEENGKPSILKGMLLGGGLGAAGGYGLNSWATLRRQAEQQRLLDATSAPIGQAQGTDMLLASPAEARHSLGAAAGDTTLFDENNLRSPFSAPGTLLSQANPMFLEQGMATPNLNSLDLRAMAPLPGPVELHRGFMKNPAWADLRSPAGSTAGLGNAPPTLQSMPAYLGS